MKTTIYYDENLIDMRGNGITKVDVYGEEMDFDFFIDGVMDDPRMDGFSIYITAISNAGGVTFALDYDCETSDERIEQAYECLAELNVEWRKI